jgi:O-antigen/teichoic acid export membrane protein
VDGEVTPDSHPEPEGAPAANASLPQLLRNVVSQYATFLIGLVASLVLTRVLLRHLGAGPYGLWIVLLAIVGYLGLLDVGVGTAAVQRIARLTAEHDSDGVADVIRTSFAFFAVSGILAVGVTAGLAPFLASFLKLGTISPIVAGATLVILGVMTLFTFLATAPNALLFGAGRGDRLAQIGLVTLILTEVGQILAVLAGGGLIALAIIQSAGIGIGLVIAAVAASRITGSPLRQGRFRRPLLGELIRFGGLQAVIALSSVVAFQFDALIIGIILPVSQVAPYNVALNTSNLSLNLSTLGTNLLLPSYAHFETIGDRRRQADYFFRSVLVSLVVSVPIVIALAAFGEPVLHLWLGSVPPKTYEIVIALGIVTTLQLPGHQCFLFLTGVGRNRVLAKLSTAGAVLNLAGSIAATYWLGPVGPAIGSMPPVAAIDFVVLPIVVCNYLGVPFAHYARSALAPVLPAAVVAGGLSLALIHLRPGHSGLAAVVGSVVVVGASWLAMAIVVARIEPELRRSLWRRIRHRRG